MLCVLKCSMNSFNKDRKWRECHVSLIASCLCWLVVHKVFRDNMYGAPKIDGRPVRLSQTAHGVSGPDYKIKSPRGYIQIQKSPLGRGRDDDESDSERRASSSVDHQSSCVGSGPGTPCAVGDRRRPSETVGKVVHQSWERRNVVRRDSQPILNFIRDT